ncbi:FHA domain-containing protein [Saccharothrix xinjiangensis]|uniref:FHA domain-containing protein n=1 Tax=Saccharothrix xinjiangensis TaxID=204798 RepID=A0ABV9XYH3_9PSEU
MVTMLLLLTAAGIALGLFRIHRNGLPDLTRLRFPWIPRLGRGEVFEVDEEHAHQRRIMLHRVAAQAARLPAPPDGRPLFITVRTHPADAELLGRDVIDDEFEVNLRLSGTGSGTRVRIREYLRVDAMPRTRVHVSPDERPTAAPPTRALVERTAAPAARLVLVGEPATSLHLPAAGGVIGRDAASCQVVIDLPTISRQHARVRPRGDGFEVEDLLSANGVTINSRTTTSGVLHHGDVLGLGRAVRLRLEIGARGRGGTAESSARGGPVAGPPDRGHDRPRSPGAPG